MVPVFLVVLFVVPAAAEPGMTLFGERGGAVLPTADLTLRSNLESALYGGVAINWYDSEGSDTVPIGAVFGIGDNIDVGGMFAFNDFSNVLGLNVKFDTQLTQAPDRTAVGFRYFRLEEFDVNVVQPYVVHTHVFPLGEKTFLDGSVGVNWTNVDLPLGSESALRIFTIVQLTRGPWSLGGEMQSQDSDLDNDPLGALFVRLAVTPQVAAQAGLTNAALDGVRGEFDDEYRIFAGLRLDF